MIAAPANNDDSAWATSGGPAILDRYSRLVDAAGVAGNQVVLLPEKLLDVEVDALPAMQSKLQALADSNKIELVVGIQVFGTDRGDFNRALVLHPDGRPPTSYNKHHLIPGLEPYQAGDTLGLMPGLGGGQWGVLICKDLDFPALARQYGQAKVDLLLVPALDFDTDGWLHSRMAVLRGIENGIPIARSGSQGLLTLSDRYGGAVGKVAAPVDSATVLTGELRPGIDPTLYTRWGDWFGWLGCLLLVVAIGSLRRPAAGTPRRRAAEAPSRPASEAPSRPASEVPGRRAIGPAPRPESGPLRRRT